MDSLEATIESWKVPRREALLRQLAAANRNSVWMLLAVATVTLILGVLIDWPRTFAEPILTVVIIGYMAGPILFFFLRTAATPRKRIEELKDSTKFGEYDKYRLQKLYDETQKKLALPDERIPLFVVADKNLNAAMMRVSLGPFFRSLTGIYLNRQVLHKLSPAEVQDILGHELGHYHRYFLISDRFSWLFILAGAILGLFIAQQFQVDGYWGLFPVMICGQAFYFLMGLQRARHAKAIEFLCDDLGAHVHGIATSISGLMKLGVEAEIKTALLQEAAFSPNRGKLQVHEIAEAIEQAVPYGHTSRAELEAAVQAQLKKKASEGPSVSGFLRYAWQGDADAEADDEYQQQMRKLKKLRASPRIPWEDLLDDPSHVEFDEKTVPYLIQMIVRQPEAKLFHSLEMVIEAPDTHPPLEARILYLWLNREAIEAGRRSLERGQH
jgi:Zn-dependent protease with chaperone function